MARRTLHHLDERICKRVIYYGAKKGIDSISTKRIASDLHISEPTIYIHFKSRADLLLATYQGIVDGLENLLENTIFNKYRGKKEELSKDLTKIYYSLFNDIYAHKDEVIFLFNYRRYASPSLSETMRKSFTAFISSFNPEISSRLEKEISGDNNFLLLAPLEIYAYEIAKVKIIVNDKSIAYMENILLSCFSKASLDRLIAD